MNWASQRS